MRENKSPKSGEVNVSKRPESCTSLLDLISDTVIKNN